MSHNTPLEANEDFASSINIYGEIGYVLKQPSTTLTCPAVIVLSDNVSEVNLDVTYVTFSENVARYIEQNQLEANISKFIIVFPNTETSLSLQEEMDLVKAKYKSIANRLLQRKSVIALSAVNSNTKESLPAKFRKFISSIFVTFEHAVIQTKSGE